MADLAPERAAALERFLTDWMIDERIPGASVAVVEDGVAYAEGFGSRDLASNAPATPRTLYGVGSCTKSLTALAVMQLHERGALDVDDPAGDFVPFELQLEGERPITLHDLLTHSSGLPSLATSEVLLDRRAGLAELGVPLGDMDDVYRHVNGAGAELVSPGERFMYCNSGYVLLGEAIEACAGEDFPTYVEREILDPLGMERSTLREAEFDADGDAMTPYHLDDGEPRPTDLPVRELSYAPGGLLSSVVELTRYLRMQMRGGTFEGETLVAPESIERMHAAHVETAAGGYGYGWGTREVLERSVVGHSGSIGVASAYVGFSPDDGVGVALAANTSPEYPLAMVGHGALAAALGYDPAETPFVGRRERLSRLTGEYESYRGIKTATVSRDGEMLRLEFDGPLSGSGTPLVPKDGAIEEFEFYALSPAGEREPVEFVVDGDDVDLYYDRWRLHQV